MKENNIDLLKLLEKLGHFKYHRRGGKIGQERILKLLSFEPEMTQKQVQEYLGIQSGSMSEIVNKLESRELITKQKDESDKRKIILRITEEGCNVLETANSEVILQEQNLFKALDEQEREDCSGLFQNCCLVGRKITPLILRNKREKANVANIQRRIIYLIIKNVIIRLMEEHRNEANDKERNNELYRRKKVDRA